MFNETTGQFSYFVMDVVEDNMKKIDISYIESKLIRTLLRFLSYVFRNEVKPTEEEVHDFILNYIPEMRDIMMDWTQNNLINLSEIEFVSDATNRLEERENDIVRGRGEKDFDEICEEINNLKYPYRLDRVACNLCTILITTDKLNNENAWLFDCIQLEEYTEAYKILSNKVDGLILISNGVSNYIMDIFREEFDLRKHYLVTPDIYININRQKEVQLYKKYLVKEKNHKCFLSDILLFFELTAQKNKEDILKILMALICMIKSCEYSETIRNCARKLIIILQEIMFCGEIHKVYIQMKEIDKDIPVEQRGSNDATTRFSIIFSASNEDIYLLRIDLPHKGEGSFHINMQEKVVNKMKEAGYPLEATYENNKMLREIVGDDFDRLFFCLNHYIWFKSDFIKKINQLNYDGDKKEKLSGLFRDRSHYAIDIGEGNEEQYYEFTSELRDYLQRFKLSRNVICSFNKDSLNVEDEMVEVRRQQHLINQLMECYNRSDNCSVDANVLLWHIYGGDELKKRISKEEFMTLDLSKCWSLIDRRDL